MVLQARLYKAEAPKSLHYHVDPGSCRADHRSRFVVCNPEFSDLLSNIEQTRRPLDDKMIEN